MYGHPHEETLSRFNDLGAEVFRTDLQGTVIAVDDGEEITFNCEGAKADRPYSEDHQEASYIGNVNSKKYQLLPTAEVCPRKRTASISPIEPLRRKRDMSRVDCAIRMGAAEGF